MSINRTSVYLDYNATAPLRPEAREALLRALESPANPSSVHAAGRAARDVVERARAEVGAFVGVPAGSVTLVSGGTEANALAIESAKAAGAQRIIVSAIEHDAVVETAKASGLPVEILSVDGDGVADLERLAQVLETPGKTLVCLMLANNETGVIQPVAEASGLVRAAGGWLHVDAVQGAGKIAVDFSALGADTMALSAHKLGGPQGVGALVAGTRATVVRRQHGGGQERGRRAGTENVAGIAGFGAAARAARESLASMAEQSHWRDALAERVKAQGAVVLGEGAARLPQTLCFAGEGFGSEVQVMTMDLAGVMVSAGSACSSGKVKASRVVEAMGRSDLAPFALRVSGGWASSEDDWIKCGDAWLAAWKRIGARRREVA
ncbi:MULTISPECIES: cysteine desulfurase family protein [unclassified Caulobacter]|uniref:cysteine desulfurase family protein n=1 Tax=unclassified Caulobacter TaxID=2648921 RepID=UPI0006FC9298|nr:MULTISPECIES: cysteine desulfurase family protein [unclassified Caulobacter]KQV57193.1 aminotransferase [Caulobacter sp. Root342]KQV66765.1 aminotransferase [Caulobacter sp. Root343]